MLRKSFYRSFLTLLFLSVFVTPLAANAQTHIVRVKENSTSLFPRNVYTVQFFNNPNVSESKFTLRLASYGEVAGCASMTEPELETQMVSGRLKLKVTDSEVILNDEDPRYSPYDCETKNNRSFFDVELDRDELISKKIKKVKLKSEEYGDFIEADIDINEDRIEFITKSSAGSHMVTFWFFPDNAVVLTAPQAKSNQDVKALIRDFGIAQGLTPMENRLEGFELPYTAKNYVMFTDQNNAVINQLETVDARVQLGDITPLRTVHSINGQSEEPYALPVFASVPKQQ